MNPSYTSKSSESKFNLDFEHLSATPNLVYRENGKLCVFNQFSINLSISNKNYHKIYLLDTTTNPTGTLLQSSALSLYFSQLSQPTFRKNSINRRNLESDLIHESTIESPTTPTEKIFFYIFKYDKKYLIAVFSHNPYSNFMNLYQKKENSISDLVDQNFNKEEKLIDEPFKELIVKMIENETSNESNIEFENEEVNEPSNEEYETFLTGLFHEMLTNPGFTDTESLLKPFHLKKEFVLKRVSLFFAALKAVLPVYHSFSEPGRCVIMAHPDDCSLIYRLRKILNLEDRSIYTIELIENEEVKPFWSRYPPCSSIIEVIRRSLAEFMRSYPLTMIFFFYDEHREVTRWKLIAKSLEVKELVQQNIDNLVKLFTPPHLISIDYSDYLEIIIGDEQNTSLTEKQPLIDDHMKQISFHYTDCKELYEKPPTVDQIFRFNRFPESETSEGVKDSLISFEKEDYSTTGEKKNINEVTLSSKLSIYLVSSKPKDFYLLTTGHKLAPNPCHISSSIPCLKDEQLSLISNVWPAYFQAINPKSYFKIVYDPFPDPSLPQTTQIHDSISDVAVIKLESIHLSRHFSYEKNCKFLNNAHVTKVSTFEVPIPTLPSPDLYLGKVFMNENNIEFTVVGYGHRAILPINQPTFVYQVFYIANCETQDTSFGDSGSALFNLKGEIHSFYIGKLAGFHILTPVNFALEQAERLLDCKSKLIPSKFLQKEKCSIS